MIAPIGLRSARDRLVIVRILCCMCAGYPAVPLGVSNGGAGGSPLGPRTGSPPESQPPSQQQQQQQQGGNGQSPMAALMSVADNLPPGSPRSTGGSPPGSGGPRSASRGSQHSPNSSGKLRREQFAVFFWVWRFLLCLNFLLGCFLLGCEVGWESGSPNRNNTSQMQTGVVYVCVHETVFVTCIQLAE
jgi:hypothetical protein